MANNLGPVAFDPNNEEVNQGNTERRSHKKYLEYVP